MSQTISAGVFYSNFKKTGISKSAIFSERKRLMEELYATGVPILCDQSYYSQVSKLDLVKKVDNHFECDGYNKFEEWRDCHYYSEYVDENGNKVWLLTGGRYD